MARTIIDVDAHFTESLEDMLPYFDEPWRSNLRNGEGFSTSFFIPGGSGDRGVGGRIQRKPMSPEEFEAEGPRGHAPTGYQAHYNADDETMTAEDVPQMMEFLDLDGMILLSHSMLAFPAIKGSDTRQIELARGSMEYMLGEIVDPDEGVYTAIPMPLRDPEAAVELIDEYGDERAVSAICLVTAGAEPPLGNRKYEPIYAAAEDAGLPAIFHTGGSGLDRYHLKGYEKFIETHTLGFLEGNMSQLTSLVIQGIPEKFPDLNLVFQESGIMYVPMLMYRLDEEYMKRPSEAPLLERRPSEYITDMYFGTQPMERPPDQEYFRKTLEVIDGPSQLLYASDFPHWDFDRPSVIEDIPFLTEPEKDSILGGNAREVFGI